VRAAIVTVSSSRAAGAGGDQSGARLRELAERLGAQVVGHEVIADERAAIERSLRHWADVERCALVMTSGGTGFSPSDLTPEATRAVIDREAPGIAEAMRAASRPHTPYWMLSRAVAGARGATLIINFPGAPASIEQVGEALREALPHALELLAGGTPPHLPAGRDR
jgi:molybdopterin adenylyltransferase